MFKRAMKQPENSQLKEKKRIEDFGEVLTPNTQVKEMLDLVEIENNRIDSKFLEPACGTGNFLGKILVKKIKIINNKYGSNKLDYERYLFLAVSSIYGIDILRDNVASCKNILFEKTIENYNKLFGKLGNPKLLNTIKFVLDLNIIWGDALKLINMGKKTPIVFSNWSIISGSLVKRTEYKFLDLIAYQPFEEGTLFSDLGDKVIIPDPVKDYKPIHYLNIANDTK